MTEMLNHEYIKQACGGAAYLRGQEYLNAGKVLDVEVIEGPMGIFLSSTVGGSQGQIYEQSIVIDERGSAPLNVNGLCSCPVMNNCKHVAAAMLYIVKSKQPPDDLSHGGSVESWLDCLEQASRKAATGVVQQVPENSNYCLIYVLAVDDSGAQQVLKVLSQKVRLLKKGGLGKPSKYALERIRASYADQFVLPVDKEIAHLLVDSNAYYYYDYENSYSLQGEIGELALRKMLSTGRFFWQDKSNQPISLGATRDIDFFWHKESDGQSLQYKIEPRINFIFRLHSIWYVDSESNLLGMLQYGSLNPEQTLALLAAPTIPNEKLEHVSRQLLLNVPEYQLESPVELDLVQIQIEDEKPVPQLLLHGMESFDKGTGERGFHAIKLSFQYGPAEVEGIAEKPLVTVEKGNTVYSVKRCADLEFDAMDELYSRGLRLMNVDELDTSERMEWLFYSDSLADSAMQWHQFVEVDIPVLKEQGWQVSVAENFAIEFEEFDQWHAELDDGTESEWFSLALGVEVDGEHVNLLPTLVALLSKAGDPETLRAYLNEQPYFMVPIGEHRWLKLPSKRLRPIFEALVELYDHEPLGEDGKLMLSVHQGIQIGDLLNDPALKWRGGDELRVLSQRLRDFHGIETVQPPTGFKTELRPYQQQGLNWMQFLRGFEFNGILADDMGLGKTVQTLALLLQEKQAGRMQRPSVIVAPTSLMGNWRRESERFSPELKVLVLHGPDRHARFDDVDNSDIVLTTYPLLRRDKKQLVERRFHYVILDESQAIKNPKSQTTQIVYQLKCAHRLCLTGTPMENHLGELWAMYHFLMPGFLGNLERFNRLFRNPIERHGDGERRQQLAKRLKPFLLRRTKQQVVAELPEKTEIVRTVTLQGNQRDLYETIRLAMDKKVREEISKKGMARSHIMILDALLKLRQVCCDPRLLSLPQAKKANQSAKLELLMEMLPELVEEGRKILLFSQFTKMLGLIEAELGKQKIDYCKLTGQTRKRDAEIQRFQEGDAPVFLISLKAGGVGLNLTAADTVIHYDPWWNPAVENQATDRAHRIGQDKAVFVYKLVTEQTVEEKIIALQQKKQALADAVYSQDSSKNTNQFSADDLTELLKPLE